MSSSARSSSPRPLRRVLILADESANWKIAGLRQLDRLAISLNEFGETQQAGERMSVCVFWNDGSRSPLPDLARLQNLEIVDCAEEFLAEESSVDLVVSTRLFLHRDGVEQLLAALPAPANVHANGAGLWQSHARKLQATLAESRNGHGASLPWKYVSRTSEIPACERGLLRGNGKSQDGLVSRYLNRPISRWISRWLLKLPITPSAWSLLIFSLPIAACFAFTSGSYLGFVVGAAIFQLYSILDGCDGEIARAKFLHTEFGRRLDSFCDLTGNVLLALTVGIGLARQHTATSDNAWLYAAEGVLAAFLTLTTEGLVFIRRSRSDASTARPGRWNGVLYERHHEFVERSGILVLGESLARWLLVLTKRDMAIFAFFILALVGQPAWILHLIVIVHGSSSLLAGNAFLRQPAPALPQEAS